MNIPGLEEYEFVPPFRGNRDLPPEEQIVAEMKPIAARDRMKCVSTQINSQGETVVVPNFAELCRYGVKKWRGLSVGGKKLESTEDLMASSGEAVDLLIRMVGMEAYIVSQRADAKNL